jgi:hypothetical protein
VVSGREGTSQLLLKFLISLFKRKNSQPQGPQVDYLVETYYDEYEKEFVRVHFMCSCQAPVVKALGEKSYICQHCDQPCTKTKGCLQCLMYNRSIDERFAQESADEQDPNGR